MPFAELPNRDAWGTIRGFVYQLDTTLLRWIGLRDNQLLELERGEDIDIVTQDFTTRESFRELEQVKYREASISLNQEVAVEMLFTFFQQLTSNPGQELLFRYVTNAPYTVERPALFVTGHSGIEVWQTLAQEAAVTLHDDRLLTLQQHLRRRVQDQIRALPVPAQATWQAFDTYLAAPGQLLHFIKSVEWSTRQPDHTAVGQAVEDGLLSARLAPDAAGAKALYARLFLYVARRLSEPALKRLSPNELRTQAEMPPLTALDQRLLSVLENMLGELEGRVSTLESAASQTRTQLIQLVGRLDLLSQTDAAFAYRLGNLATTPPPLVRAGSQREQKVAQVRRQLEATPWVHLPGIHGSGKSQLAAQIARSCDNSSWLELQAYRDSAEQAALLLQAFLAQVTQQPVAANRLGWLRGALASLPPQSLLVINDMPRIEPGSALETCLVELVAQLVPTDIRLLTTSNFTIPSGTQQLLSVGTWSEYADLRFTDEEIVECLTNRGAGAEVVAWAGAIGAVTHRNPTLVGALLHQLQSLNWGTDDAQLLTTLLTRDFMASPQEEVQRAINRQLPDTTAQDLLYRLSLLKWGFGLAQMRAVSEVTIALRNPFEAWQRILHLWVQPTGAVYYVSPLVHNLGEQNLPAQTVREVHLAAAESILAGHQVDLLDATWCFHSLCKGENHVRAGSVLVSLFHTATTAEQAKLLRYCGLLRYATDIDFPATMPRLLRAHIRTEQVRLHHLLGLESTAYQQWLTAYADATDNPEAEGVVLRLLKLLNVTEWELPEFACDLLFVVRNRNMLTETTEASLPAVQLAPLFWLPVHSIHSATDLTKWCELADALREQGDVLVWEEPIAPTAVTLVARQVAAQAAGPDLAQVALEEWATYFGQHNLELLRATVDSVRILLRFQQAAARPSVLAEGAATIATITQPEARYLLYFALGKACYDAGLVTEGAAWLEQAVAVQCTRQDSFTEALVYAAAATALANPALALHFSRQAQELAAANEDISGLNYLQVLAELALAEWLNNHAQASFDLFEQVVSQLLDSQVATPPTNWIRFYVLLRHVLGYVAPATARERPPQRVADGGDYVAPYQGFFFFNTKDLSDLYTANPDHHILCYAMALFADGIGDTTRAYVWSQRAFDAARRANGEMAQLMIAALCGQYALATGHYPEALEAQILSAAMSAYVQHTGLPQEQAMDNLDLKELAALRPGPVWDAAEATAVTLAVLPMLVQVLTAQASGEARAAALAQTMQKTIEQYQETASNQAHWTQVRTTSADVLANRSTSVQLLAQAVVFGQNNQRDLQVMCLLGVIARSHDGRQQAAQLLSVLPYLVNVQQVQPIIIRTVLVPFAKFWSKVALQACFVGTRVELAQQLAAIEAVDPAGLHALQQIVRPAVTAAELTSELSRASWLSNGLIG